MQPLRIRLRNIRRALRAQAQDVDPATSEPRPEPEAPVEGEVRITDGQDPSRYVVVKLVEEEYRGQRYAVIEVLEIAPGTRIAFVTADVKV